VTAGNDSSSAAAIEHVELVLEPADNRRLAWLCGQFDDHLREVERRLQVAIHHRGHHFQISGQPPGAERAARVVQALYLSTEDGPLSAEMVHLQLQTDTLAGATEATPATSIRTRRGAVRPRGPHQAHYLEAIQTHDISFGIGPAGTGKTYLAVAAAVEALERERVRRLVLTRPAVEAGERLGFLPGDMAQKVDPYLRPLYDALFEMLGYDRVSKLLERGTIEVAPLAFMRGRTLNESFIILDEAQNTTPEQMKMFLTRIGFGSTAVVTGDVTQIDLPRSQSSGLRQAVDLLPGTEGIHFTFFDTSDVVRHPVVARILQAYEADARAAAAREP
jgi:phosphate starvation-inducible protein PhoH and related proteins